MNKTHSLINPNWQFDKDEEDHLRRWYGSRYMGHGVLRCAFCQDNHHFIGEGLCGECKVAIDQLGWVYPGPGEGINRFIEKGTYREDK